MPASRRGSHEASPSNVGKTGVIQTLKAVDHRRVVIGLSRLRSGGARLKRDGGTIIGAADNGNCERIVTLRADSGSPWELFHFLNGDRDRTWLLMYVPFWVCGIERVIPAWAQETRCSIDRDKSGCNREIMRAMDCQMTGIQFIIKTRQRFLVRCHAGLGFEGDEHIADWSLVELWKFCQFRLLGGVQLNPVVIRQVLQGPIASGDRAGGLANDEIEVLLPIVPEVADLVIYAETNPAVRDMTLQGPAGTQQIENDSPAGDLGMMVATTMIIPCVAVGVLDRGD